MTQEEADKIFETDLGRQLEVIYVTSDDRVFIRYEEAVLHTNDMMNADPENFVDTSITAWYSSYEPHLNMSTYPNGITQTTKTMGKEILEGNKLIVAFMELKPTEWRGMYSISHNHCTCRESTPEKALDGFASIAKYHESWDWLMPVLTKIGNDTGHELVIHAETSYWNQFGDNSLITDFLGYEYPLQDGIWRAVVEFIKWYNENNKTNDNARINH